MGPCVEWTKAVSGNGYGQTWCPIEKRQIGAHRKAWKDAGRELPPGMEIRHACDNPLCVNLDHLSIGTRKDNAQDCVVRGRRPTGERNHAAKLTEGQVRAIRADLRSDRKVAADYGMSFGVVNKVRRRVIWRDVV